MLFVLLLGLCLGALVGAHLVRRSTAGRCTHAEAMDTSGRLCARASRDLAALAAPLPADTPARLFAVSAAAQFSRAAAIADAHGRRGRCRGSGDVQSAGDSAFRCVAGLCDALDDPGELLALSGIVRAWREEFGSPRR